MRFTALTLTSVTAAALLAAPASAAVAKPAKAWDFNGDGRRDLLVVGAVGKDTKSRPAVSVVFGGTRRHQLVKNAAGGASADFDRDGYADLATVPSGTGSKVTIVYGGPKGLTKRRSSVSAAGETVTGLVAGAYDRKRGADLVVLVRDGYRYYSGAKGGGVKTRLPSHWVAPEEGLSPDAHGVSGGIAGDFNGDGRLDLALHDRWEIIAGFAFVPGTGNGLGAPVYTDYKATPPRAAADVTGDGVADIVGGLPSDPVSENDGWLYGTTQVLRGSKTGPVLLQQLREAKDLPSAPGGVNFGGAAAATDLNGDGRADVALGDASNGKKLSGQVRVLYGTSKGLTGRRSQLWSQATAGVPGSAENGDRFGASVVFLHLTGDRRADLAVLSSRENGVGRITVLPNRGGRIAAKGSYEITARGLGLTYLRTLQ